jgi:hypothetical protein
MAEHSHKVMPEHRLTVKEVLGSLMKDGLVDKADGDALIAESRLKRTGVHPLVIVAEKKWKSLKEPFGLLTLDRLSEWFAGKVGLEYFNIDPLKVDFTAVTDVVSSAFAARFNILAVQVTPDEVVFATAEPFLRGWIKEIGAIAKKRIRRVIANPLTSRATRSSSTTSRARSRKRRSKGIRVPGYRPSSNSSNSGAPTGNSTPTTSTSSTSSTGYGNTPSSSAPATSTSNPAASWASYVFASTACCTTSTRFR